MSAPEVTGALEAARAYRDRGWRPIPLRPRDKRPTGPWAAKAASKPTDQMLELWFGGETFNVGIACKPSGLLVVDEDQLDALLLFAAERGEGIPLTYRVRTRKGWHYYFDASEYPELGNSAGELAEYGIDVRGGGDNEGGYVVAAGSVHPSGHVYTAEDPDAPVAMLPGWLAEAIATRPARDPSTGASAPINGWSDEPRYGDAVTLHAQYQRHLNGVRSRGGAFRYELFLAALDGWRLVDLGLLQQNAMLEEIRQAIVRVWHNEPDDRDRQIVYVEARAKAQASPWVLSGATVVPGSRLLRAGSADQFFADEGDTESGESGAQLEQRPPTAAELYEREKELEKRRLRIRREAAAELAAEEREPLRVLSAREFLKAPMPDYLVPKMLYRDGLAVVFGPPGAAKSFLVLDIALSFATGTPWRGRGIGRGRVHYVMAEGQATNTLRTLAWLHHHEVDPAELDGWLTVVPQAVVLTEAGVADYLEHVRNDQPDLIVLDTKNLMFAGKESQGDDYGAMLRVLHAMRQAAGGASVVLIDHSGLGDDTRTRGSNAQKGGVETEVRVVEDENGIRQVEITRDKSGATGARWAFRLHQIPEVPRPLDVDPPAVCVPVENDELKRALPSLRDSCWDMPRSELPEVVAKLPNAAGEAACDLFRMLLYVQDVDGLTAAQMNTMLGDAPRTHSRAAVYRAVSLLAEKTVVVAGTTGKSWVLAPGYVGWLGRSEYVSELS